MSQITIGSATLHLGDCRDVLKSIPDASVDAIVTDAPYELGFMGRDWDRSGVANDVAVWAECLRVLKPGGHLLAFGGSRTYHRMACAIEDAGFELRDQIMWLYGSGFPKSLDVSKAIDKAAGVERGPGVEKVYAGGHIQRSNGTDLGRMNDDGWRSTNVRVDTLPTTDAARQWSGWGTALKPAHEPICVARKPLVGTVAANVLQHGTGALNIDACRIETIDNLNGGAYAKEGGRAVSQSLHGDSGMNQPGKTTGREFVQPLGRWPANVIHDGSDEVLVAFGQFGEKASGSGAVKRASSADGHGNAGSAYGAESRPAGTPMISYGDTGSAARFFYCAKASRADRNAGCDELPDQKGGMNSNTSGQHITRRDGWEPEPVKNNHPTVKPTELMAYLCRLVTPPGGVVLDPFMGSGSTGKACAREGFAFVGIDTTPEYVEIARARINHELERVATEAAARAAEAAERDRQPDLFQETA
ncbi:hypothetical protein WT01_15745 [Burkholderia cepacia]|uniref:DNA-methyltransferase n=1 Tax=Burkholderia cepacia TaxID=292 RepID=UPI000757E66E|nr:DNA methyltransferase [Burkholderia cepacia]KVL59280.1 hypothetical protein WT01_15745 [Burkholderia cepacia]